MADEMNLLVNQQMARARPLAALLYWRDGAWRELSERVLFPVTLSCRLRSPATLSLVLENSDGLLARDNQPSPLNRNQAGQYDPLLEEMRKVRLLQGVRACINYAAGHCYTCTPPSPQRPDSGGELTDGNFATTNPSHAAWVGWYGQNTVTVTVDLDSANPIAGVAARCLSAEAYQVLLPTRVAVSVGSASAGGPFTPVGEMPLDHLANDLAGRAHCLSLLDLAASGRWVRLEFTCQPNSWLQVDEVAVYHGVFGEDLLQTTFTGYLGDAMSQDGGWGGQVRLEQIRDTTKRLADLFIETYSQYRDQTVEAIVRDLLTNPTYGACCAEADFELAASEFVMPRWTSQNQSLLASCQELARVLGWVFGADVEGKYRLAPLSYEERTAEHVFRGDRDLMAWRKTASGLKMRNVVVVRSRDSASREITAKVQDATSVASYGPRLFALNEPTVKTGPLARQLALAVLRDYGLVQGTGTAVARANVLLVPGQVVAVHEPEGTASRSDQLYRLVALEAEQTGDYCGEHTMTLSLASYRPSAPGMPQGLVATPGDQSVSLDWGDNPEPQLAGYRVYQADAMAGPYQLIEEPQESEYLVTGLTNDQTYWFRVSALDRDGVEGDACGVVAVTPSAPGGPPVTPEQFWQIQGLVATKVQAWGTYLCRLEWDRPLQGTEVGALYNVYRAKGIEPWKLVASVTPSGQAHEVWYDRGLRLPAGTYWWRVTYYHAATGFEGDPATPVSLIF